MVPPVRRRVARRCFLWCLRRLFDNIFFFKLANLPETCVTRINSLFLKKMRRPGSRRNKRKRGGTRDSYQESESQTGCVDISDLTCSICHDVYKQAVICCKQGHSLCHSCMNAIIRIGRRICPLCRQDLIEAIPNLALRTIIENSGLQDEGSVRSEDTRDSMPELVSAQFGRLIPLQNHEYINFALNAWYNKGGTSSDEDMLRAFMDENTNFDQDRFDFYRNLHSEVGYIRLLVSSAIQNRTGVPIMGRNYMNEYSVADTWYSSIMEDTGSETARLNKLREIYDLGRDRMEPIGQPKTFKEIVLALEPYESSVEFNLESDTYAQYMDKVIENYLDPDVPPSNTTPLENLRRQEALLWGEELPINIVEEEGPHIVEEWPSEDENDVVREAEQPEGVHQPQANGFFSRLRSNIRNTFSRRPGQSRN